MGQRQLIEGRTQVVLGPLLSNLVPFPSVHPDVILYVLPQRWPKSTLLFGVGLRLHNGVLLSTWSTFCAKVFALPLWVVLEILRDLNEYYLTFISLAIVFSLNVSVCCSLC